MISTFARTARLDFSTEESMATPCSVKANGRYLMFWPLISRRRACFKVTNCDLDRSASSQESWNMKSDGNRSAFRLTAWFRTFASTP